MVLEIARLHRRHGLHEAVPVHVLLIGSVAAVLDFRAVRVRGHSVVRVYRVFGPVGRFRARLVDAGSVTGARAGGDVRGSFLLDAVRELQDRRGYRDRSRVTRVPDE